MGHSGRRCVDQVCVRRGATQVLRHPRGLHQSRAIRPVGEADGYSWHCDGGHSGCLRGTPHTCQRLSCYQCGFDICMPCFASAGGTGSAGGLFAALASDGSDASRAAPAPSGFGAPAPAATFGAPTLTGQALVLSGASDSPAAYLFGEYGWRMGGSWHCATTGKILWVQNEELGVISTVANSTTASAVMRLNASLKLTFPT